MASPDDVYFAAQTKEEIGQALANKLEGALGDSLRAAQYSKAYAHYYAVDGTTSGITRGGAEGELAEIRINKARALAKAVCGIVTGPKMTWRPQAPNGSHGARTATTVAMNLLEFYWKRRYLNRAVFQWVETSFAFSEGFVFPEWDVTRGPVVAVSPDGDGLIREGDLTFHNVLPWDVVREDGYKRWEDSQWSIVTLYKNKYDLVGLYETDITGEPAKEKILAAQKKSRWMEVRRASDGKSDVIPVHYFFHAPSPALPVGRETVFLNAECILKDEPLVYDEVPVYRLAADEQLDTCYGYTSWWDCLSTQELMDGLETAIATNQLTLSTQSIAMPIGTQTPPDHAHGMKVFYYPPNSPAPTPLQLTKSPPEVFGHLKAKAADQQQLVGLNDVFRGQPDTAQMNAQAFAILASMAIQANSPFQTATVDAVGRLGTGVLKILQKRVSRERKVAITGKNSRNLFSSLRYTGEDLKPIDAVYVEIGSAMEQTPAGRFQLAQMHMSIPGVVRTPDELQQVMDTGRLEPATQAARDELLLIASENERLADGESPPVHTYDNHLLHGKEHVSPLMNPDGRDDPRVVEAVQAHWDEHYRLYWGLPPGTDPVMDPQYIVRKPILLGQQPPPTEGPPPPGGAPMGPGGPPPGASPSAMMGPPPPGPESLGPGAMPQNPMNGQPFSPTGGPLPPA